MHVITVLCYMFILGYQCRTITPVFTVICWLNRTVNKSYVIIHTFSYFIWYPRGRISANDDVIEWKHFPHCWPFVRWLHRSPVDSPHKGQGRGTLMFSLICALSNNWANNRDTGDLRRHYTQYDVAVMFMRHIGVENYRICIHIFIIYPLNSSAYQGLRYRSCHQLPWQLKHIVIGLL